MLAHVRIKSFKITLLLAALFMTLLAETPAASRINNNAARSTRSAITQNRNQSIRSRWQDRTSIRQNLRSDFRQLDSHSFRPPTPAFKRGTGNAVPENQRFADNSINGIVGHRNIVDGINQLDRPHREIAVDRQIKNLDRSNFSFNLHLGNTPAVAERHIRNHTIGYHHPQIFHQIVHPRYYYPTHSYVSPHFRSPCFRSDYHRKYVFISLGGYWPIRYRYARYYWYGYQPYINSSQWPYEVDNVYIYNNVYNSTDTAEGLTPVDENTFADVRERLAAQAKVLPDEETDADRYFDKAVKAFETGDYNIAADSMAHAIDLEPNDKVLPFAYTQALFAIRQYYEAAKVLREAIRQLPADEKDIFYPRGLYPDDNILFEQIDRLAEEAKLAPSDKDMQLLLGYQLLGAGKVDEASKLLQQIRQDPENAEAADVLLRLMENIETDNTEY